MKKIFCCPALELFCCLPLWKTVLFVSSRAFSLSTPTFLLSTPVENSEATWKKATKCNKSLYWLLHLRSHNEMKSFLKKHSYFIQLHFLKMSMIRHRAVHKNKNTLSIISLLVLRCLSLNISSYQSCPNKVVLASYSRQSSELCHSF